MKFPKTENTPTRLHKETAMLHPESTLHDQVTDALNDPRFAKRELRFESSEGSITLTGKVTSFYQKQMAQELVGKLNGVREIDNQLEVCWL